MSDYSHDPTQENYFICPSLQSPKDLMKLHHTRVRMVLDSCNTETNLALVLSFFYTILNTMTDSL